MKDKKREALQELVNKNCFLIHEFKSSTKYKEIERYEELNILEELDDKISEIFYPLTRRYTWMYHIARTDINQDMTIIYKIKTSLNNKVIFYRYHVPIRSDITYKIL